MIVDKEKYEIYEFVLPSQDIMRIIVEFTVKYLQIFINKCLITT